MSGTGFRKGDRIYANNAGFATVISGESKSYDWGGETMRRGEAIPILVDGGDRKSFTMTSWALKLTPQTEALLGGLGGIHSRFSEIAREMLRQGKPVRELEDLFKAAVVVIDVARNTGR